MSGNLCRYCDFLDGYAEFLEDVQKKEAAKLKALLERDYELFAELLHEFQTDSVKAEDYEKKRLEFCREFGVPDKTFEEHMEDCEDAVLRKRLQDLRNRFRTAVFTTQHTNKQILEIAQMNLDIIAEIETASSALPVYGQDGVKKDVPAGNSSFFNTKI